MIKKTAALLFIATNVFAGSAQAQEKKIDTIPYPSSKSFAQVTDQVITPYFREMNRTTITYGKLYFTLWDFLPEIRKNYLLNKTKYDPAKMRDLLSYASVTLSGKTKDQDNTILLANGVKVSPPEEANKSHEWYSLSLANFDSGKGLMIDFAPMRFKVYMSPVSNGYLRAFTVSPYHVYWDKTYYELDKDQANIKNIAYYYAFLDASIKGDLSLASTLSLFEQELLVDNLTIAIAEYYQGEWAHNMSYRYIFNRSATRDPFTRSAPPAFNVPLTLYINHGMKQINTVKNRGMIQEGNLFAYYNRSSYMTPDRLLNERMISRALLHVHPYEFSRLAQKLGYKFSGNFFEMLCFLMENPDYYDAETRVLLRKIIGSVQNDVLLINGGLTK